MAPLSPSEMLCFFSALPLTPRQRVRKDCSPNELPSKEIVMRRMFLIATLCLFLSGHAPALQAATCTGSTPCKACKNCKYCKHCSTDGGKCGVCRYGNRSGAGLQISRHDPLACRVHFFLLVRFEGLAVALPIFGIIQDAAPVAVPRV